MLDELSADTEMVTGTRKKGQRWLARMSLVVAQGWGEGGLFRHWRGFGWGQGCYLRAQCFALALPLLTYLPC